MKKTIVNVGKTMIAMGASELGWRLIFRKSTGEDILKDERVIAGAIVMGAGAAVTAIGSNLKDKEEAVELDEVVEIGL